MSIARIKLYFTTFIHGFVKCLDECIPLRSDSKEIRRKIYLISFKIFGRRGKEFGKGPRRKTVRFRWPRRASVHNSRLVQYRLSRVRSTGQAKEKEERGSMKDSFRVGRVQLSLHSVEREIGRTARIFLQNLPPLLSL